MMEEKVIDALQSCQGKCMSDGAANFVKKHWPKVSKIS